MDEAGYVLKRYYLSYKLGLQEEGKRESQEKEEISIPAKTIPQTQEIAVYYEETTDNSELESVFEEDLISSANKYANSLSYNSVLYIPRSEDRITEIVLSALSPNATPFCPCAEIS